ncbi:MAG: telomerase inhibitor [Candelina submexicana]|nr:MAG: telomerase inhibitor [Candelina submexicana]
MGLSESRKRAKISHDPRNTNWSKSTTNFGHKILIAQGWTPGSFLGAQDAPHAGLHTEANASHIRVAIKDDNLGVGALGSKQPEGECVGLDAFQGILGRLNGKSAGLLEKERQSRNNVKRLLSTQQRWGGVHFVKGGLLVGDKIETAFAPTTEESAVLIEQNARKGKAVATDAEGKPSTPHGELKGRRKADERSVNLDVEDESLPSAELGYDCQGLPGIKKDKHLVAKLPCSERKSEKMPQDHVDSLAIPTNNWAQVPTSSARNPQTRSQEKLGSARRRLERHNRREQKRLRKEQQAAKVGGHTNSSTKHINKNAELDTGGSVAVTTAADQASAVASQPRMLVGRHSVRQRHIQHKKMAVMDPRALNEIFMIKT